MCQIRNSAALASTQAAPTMLMLDPEEARWDGKIMIDLRMLMLSSH